MAPALQQGREQRMQDQESAKRMFDMQIEIEPGKKRQGPGVFHPPLPEQRALPQIQETPVTAQQSDQARALALRLGYRTSLPKSKPIPPALRREQDEKLARRKANLAEIAKLEQRAVARARAEARGQMLAQGQHQGGSR